LYSLMGVAASFDQKQTSKCASLIQSHLALKNKTSDHGFTWGNKIIGTGEYSTVYRGYQRESRLPIAVKKIQAKNLTKVRKTRIMNEIAIMNQICKLPDHDKYFVTLLDAFSDDLANAFIVTKFIEGQELYKIATAHPTGLSERVVRQMMRQILLAVHVLHQNDIAHRDIKLENIIFDKDSKRLKLIDFGFATKTSSINSNGNKVQNSSSLFCGSVHYVAPEIVLEQPHDSKKVDIWALGVLAYTLFTGEFPFDNSNQQILLKSIANGNFTLPRNLSPEAKALLNDLLLVNPTKRPSAASLLHHSWWTIEL